MYFDRSILFIAILYVKIVSVTRAYDVISRRRQPSSDPYLDRTRFSFVIAMMSNDVCFWHFSQIIIVTKNNVQLIITHRLQYCTFADFKLIL
jgi:hypothetical protein